MQHATATAHNELPGHPYAMTGGIVALGVAVATVSAWFGFVIVPPLSLGNALFGLALIEAALAASLVYVLVTLRGALDGGARDRPYERAGAALALGGTVLAVVAWFGEGWAALPGSPRVFVALSGVAVVLAAGVTFLLVTLSASLEPGGKRRHDHLTTGFVVGAGLAAVVTLSFAPGVGLGPVPASGLPFALATITGVTGLSLSFILLTLNDSIAELRFQRMLLAARDAGAARHEPLRPGLVLAPAAGLGMKESLGTLEWPAPAKRRSLRSLSADAFRKSHRDATENARVWSSLWGEDDKGGKR